MALTTPQATDILDHMQIIVASGQAVTWGRVVLTDPTLFPTVAELQDDDYEAYQNRVGPITVARLTGKS